MTRKPFLTPAAALACALALALAGTSPASAAPSLQQQAAAAKQAQKPQKEGEADRAALEAAPGRTSLGPRERADQAIAEQRAAAGLDPLDVNPRPFEAQSINVAVDPGIKVMTAAPATSPTLSREDQDGTRIEPLPVLTRDIRFADMEYVDSGGGVFLSGIRPSQDIYFYMPRDEVAEDAVLKLCFTPSPSLIPVISQLNVYLNHSLQLTIPIVKETLGRKTEISLKLNPLLLRDHNAITLEFRGSYSEYCTNPLSTTLWLSVGAESQVTLHAQKLRVADDLSFFPIPFIDTVTPARSEISAVFPKGADKRMAEAAGIFASYAGAAADWRGAQCRAFEDALPASGHAIVFATNEKRPSFLRDYPKTDVPRIEIASISPLAPEKMLIISAPDSEGLVTAVKALTSGQIMLNGPVAEVKGYKELKPRPAYDAPKWVDTTRPTRFSELATYEGQLSRTAIRPAPISVELNLPPDLYFVQGSRVNMDLHYRYSRPAPEGVSQMHFMLNNHLVRSYPLNSDSEASAVLENLPFLGGIDLFSGSKVDTLLLHPQNVLTFDFQYSLTSASRVNYCVTQTLINNRVEIEPSSTIDFSDTYHFAKMPNLGLFWQSSYPFSIYADWQRSAVLLDKLGMDELTVLMNAMSRSGRLTGAEASSLRVIVSPGKDSIQSLKDLDLLVIGPLPDFLKQSAEAVSAVTEQQRLLTKRRQSSAIPDEAGPRPDLKTEIGSSSGLSSATSFRSPLNGERTVVALSADSAEGYSNLSYKLATEHGVGLMQGTSAVIRGDAAECSDEGETYYIGDLPWYQRIWYHVMNQGPATLVLISLLAAALFCWLLYRLLRAVRRSRLLEGRKEDR